MHPQKLLGAHMPQARRIYPSGCAFPRTLTAYAALARQAMALARAPHALRWRLETFGLYMPSLPEAHPWWRVNLRALGALLGQLPGYARWLGGMLALREGGASGWWQADSGAMTGDWEQWLALCEKGSGDWLDAHSDPGKSESDGV